MKSADRVDISAGMLILRLGVAYTMIMGHGWMKISNYGMLSEKFGDPIGIGVTPSLVLVIFAEFFCSILIALGLFTRLAAIPLIVTMAVAYFIANADKAFAIRELALVYMIIYTAILFIGAGRFSADALVRK